MDHKHSENSQEGSNSSLNVRGASTDSLSVVDRSGGTFLEFVNTHTKECEGSPSKSPSSSTSTSSENVNFFEMKVFIYCVYRNNNICLIVVFLINYFPV